MDKIIWKSDEEILLDEIRSRREDECFRYINRGKLWYELLDINQLDELKQWYVKWLNVTETLQVPDKPMWLI